MIENVVEFFKNLLAEMKSKSNTNATVRNATLATTDFFCLPCTITKK